MDEVFRELEPLLAKTLNLQQLKLTAARREQLGSGESSDILIIFYDLVLFRNYIRDLSTRLLRAISTQSIIALNRAVQPPLTTLKSA